MEKSTLLARKAMFAVSLCFLFSITSCTTDTQEDELYAVQAKASTQNNSAREQDKDKDKPEDKDFVDKKKIKLPNKRGKKK